MSQEVVVQLVELGRGSRDAGRIFARAIPLSLAFFYLVLKREKEGGGGVEGGELYYSRYKFPRIELYEQRFPLLSNDHVHGHVAKRVADYF